MSKFLGIASRSSLIVLILAAMPGNRSVAQPAFTREAMLRDVTRNVLVSQWQDFARKCGDLTNSVTHLLEKPSQSSLEDARKAWLEASLVAANLRCFQAGPIAERDSIATFYYWQILAYRMQGVLGSSNIINQSFLEEQGCVVKGLFAVEYLLFESGSHTNSTGKTALILEGLAGPDAEKYRQFLLTLAQELSAKAALIASDWKAPGGTAAGQKFATGGQQSLNLLVNQLAAAIENAAERHLHFVLVLPQPISRQLYRVERSRSGSSLEGALASVEGAQKFFSGNGGLGLKDAVRQVNPELEKRLAEQFEVSISAIRALNVPLEVAAVKNRAAVENAYEKTRALEILLKVDLVSALGVTLTFSSNDGD